MTIFSVIAALLGISVCYVHLGRTAVLLVLSYLALRRSEPAERKEILEALVSAFRAVGSPDHPAGGPSGPSQAIPGGLRRRTDLAQGARRLRRYR